MPALRSVVFGVALAVLGASAPAYACSCGWETGDLLPQLKRAFDGSVEVVIARALEDSRAETPTTAFEVREVFKGPLKPGARVAVASGGPGRSSCLERFSRGEEWLVYSYDAALSVRRCTRSRRLTGDDPELAWLRKQVVPPVPRAVQRGRSTCSPCDHEAVAREMAPRGRPVSLVNGLDAGVAFRTEDAFCDERGGSCIVGQTDRGRFFEVIAPSQYTAPQCSRRVIRRWCSALRDERRDPSKRCVAAGEDEVVCDEAATRQTTWSPPETTDSASCLWLDPAHPECTFSSKPNPKKAGDSAVRAGPMLRCLPTRSDPKTYACELE